MKMKKLQKFVPFYNNDGSKGKIDIHSIPTDKWASHHGTALDGTKVNSLDSITVGASTILVTQNGATLSVKTQDLEVFATQFAEKCGYSLTPAKHSRSANA